ncbi:MAG TPA: MFS transporter [Candidatus Limiplasma sp.]|nr:MFS transporter [Candidatus Limiplasma sp.]
MASILLVVIYIAFISLGLPDSLLGSAWPSMYKTLHVPLSYAGILTMVIAGCTIVSSLMSAKMIRKFGTGIVTTVSVALTAIALFGFSISQSFWVLVLWGLPYGLGAGSVDAALNNFVALHYQARHMSWLHCFWGVGATVGPSIMGLCLTHNLPWNAGYQSIGIIQVVLVIGLFLSLPLWKKQTGGVETTSHAQGEPVGFLYGLRIPGAKQTLLAFFCYCSLESTVGLWSSSYMVEARGIPAQTAASMASLFFLGITGGRLISGFVAAKLQDRQMVHAGIALIALGVVCVLLPLGNMVMFAGLVIIGLGCAPIFPSLLHETPANFGAEKSQMLMGMQMASAYTGSTLMPLVFGLVAQHLSIGLFPIFLLLFLMLMLTMTERANKTFLAQAAVTAPEA